MDTWVVVVLCIALAVIVLVALARRAVRLAGRGADPTTLTLDPAVVGQARRLVAGGQRIEAIRVLRDGTPGLSLLHAKAMVDRMAAAAAPARADGGDVDPMVSTSASIRRVDPPAWPTTVGPDGIGDLPADVELQALSLVADGQKVAAVKLIRERTGWSLADAKAFVDTLG